MYTKEGTIQDRREMLKVKALSLAEEARIIRRLERKTQIPKDTGLPPDYNPLMQQLHHHRTVTVRREARATHLARGFIKGRTYNQMENGAKTNPDWAKVKGLLERYGPNGVLINNKNLPPEVFKS